MSPLRDWAGRPEEVVHPRNRDSLSVLNEAESEEAEHHSLSARTQYGPEVLESALLLETWVPLALGLAAEQRKQNKKFST